MCTTFERTKVTVQLNQKTQLLQSALCLIEKYKRLRTNSEHKVSRIHPRGI